MEERAVPVIFEKVTRKDGLFFRTSLCHLLPNSDFLHYHDAMELGVCLSGSGRYLTVGGEVPFSSGDVQVILPSHPHYNISDENGSLWVFVDVDIPRIRSHHISPDPAYFSELIRNASASGIYTSSAHPDIVASVRSVVGLMRTECAGESPMLDLIVARLQTLLLELSMLDGNRPVAMALERKSELLLPAIHAATHAIEAGERMTPRDMASTCFLSDSYFRRIFSEVMGEPPKKYLLRLQTQRAAALLVTTKLSVGEIARRTGEEDFSTFYRRFVKAYGVSPEAYRRDAANVLAEPPQIFDAE